MTLLELAKNMEFDKENDYFDRVLELFWNGQKSCFMKEMKVIRENWYIEEAIDYLEQYRSRSGWGNPIFYYAKKI